MSRFHEVFLDTVGDAVEVAGDFFEPVVVVDNADHHVVGGVVVVVVVVARIGCA